MKDCLFGDDCNYPECGVACGGALETSSRRHAGYEHAEPDATGEPAERTLQEIATQDAAENPMVDFLTVGGQLVDLLRDRERLDFLEAFCRGREDVILDVRASGVRIFSGGNLRCDEPTLRAAIDKIEKFSRPV